MNPIDGRVLRILLALVFLAGVSCTMDMSRVSPAVRATVEKEFPDAIVQEVELEFGNVYEIELTQGEESAELKVHQDGTILEIETVIDPTELPKPVAATATERAKGSKLEEVEKTRVLARPTLGGVEELAEPEVYYEIEWLAGGFEHEIKVNPDGTLR